ncbi:MAG TPA: hypothetical protein PKK12_03225 [Candidatus Aminicenantes bacterium]|nr:hypothetical protein [Candidatus Aminicenantes bacterium]
MENNTPAFSFEDKEPWLRQPKAWALIATAVLGVVLAFVFYRSVIRESWSTAEVGKSIQVISHTSVWVDKVNKYNEVIVVPSFTFRVRNNGRRPIQYVNFDGVFEYEETKESIGSGYTTAIQKALPPGEVSGDIFVKSDYGYKASSKAAFFHNIGNWKKVRVKLYARTKSSGYALLGIFPIQQMIEGVKVVNP